MKKNKLVVTACPLCGSSDSADYEVLYPANFQLSQISTAVFSARRLPDRLHYELVQCQRDGMIRSQHILPADRLAALYQHSTYTYQSEADNLRATYLRAMAPVLQKLRSHDPILEIGCGNGFVLSGLAAQGFTQLHGVEPSHDAIAQAETSIRKKIKAAVFSKRLFPRQRFKLVCFFQTLDHIPDPVQFLRDCYDVLEPGGWIVSFHHDVQSWSARLLKEASPIIDVEHTHLYSQLTTRVLFAKLGFRVRAVFSPTNTLSLKHVAWLLPLPNHWKQKLLLSTHPTLAKILQYPVELKLGNICIIAQKPPRAKTNS